MDERSRTALEFAGILDFLREGAATPLGKERGADVRPLKDPTRVREALAEAGETSTGPKFRLTGTSELLTGG